MADDYVPEHRADKNNDPVIGDPPPRASVLFSNEVYDKLKFVAMVLLPALGTLYFTIAAITGLPYGDEVVGVVLAVDTFLGVILGISTSQYKNDDNRFDGVIDVQPDYDAGETVMNVSIDPMAVVNKDEVVVKVVKPS